MLAGLVVPVGLVAYVAARDPQPRSCNSGLSTAAHISGAIVWSTPGVLWLADGDISRSQRLADYAPVRQPPASPSPSAAPASPVASPSSTPVAVTPGPSPSPSPPPIPAAAIEAAAVSSDRKLVAFLVSNPPDEPGKISLRYVSPQDPPGTAAKEIFSGAWGGDPDLVSQVGVLPDNQHILFQVPHHFDPPETDPVLVGIGEVGAVPRLAEQDPLHTFIRGDHAAWPETKDYKLPPDQPRLQSRVIGPNGRVVGLLVHIVSTPLVSRSLSEIVGGRSGSPQGTIVCASADPLRTVAFAPDGHSVAVVRRGATEVLDLDGDHSLTPLVRGAVLAWRP